MQCLPLGDGKQSGVSGNTHKVFRYQRADLPDIQAESVPIGSLFVVQQERIRTFPNRFLKKWQGLPLLWKALPLLWQGLPLFSHGVRIFFHAVRKNFQGVRKFSQAVRNFLPVLGKLLPVLGNFLPVPGKLLTVPGSKSAMLAEFGRSRMKVHTKRGTIFLPKEKADATMMAVPALGVGCSKLLLTCG